MEKMKSFKKLQSKLNNVSIGYFDIEELENPANDNIKQQASIFDFANDNNLQLEMKITNRLTSEKKEPLD